MIRERVEADLPALVGGLALVAELNGYPSVWPRDPAGWLRCDEDRNTAAIRLYERLGWTRLGSFEAVLYGGTPPELLHCFAAP